MAYEYRFVKVPLDRGLKKAPGDAFDRCQSVVAQAAREGWRLVQIIAPFHEKLSTFSPLCYQVILEREAV